MSSHVFISYSHADAPLAESIALAFHRSGVSFAIDHLVLSPGDSLTARLGKAIERADTVVALISASSIESEWVRRELATAQARGIRVVPVKCDDTTWPAELALGDSLHVDARQRESAVGRIPKLFVRSDDFARAELNAYFPLSSRPRSPLCRIFPGSLEAALDEAAYGRVLLVVPTNNAVDLSGKVASAVLAFLGVSREDLRPDRPHITSRQVSHLLSIAYRSLLIEVVAATVFAPDGRLAAEDQVRAAEAILTAAHDRRCALAIVPPLGTGVYGWPASKALRNWLFGAIRWAAQAPVTEDSPWPILCQPGAGAQRAIGNYLTLLDGARLAELAAGRLQFTIRHGDEVGTAMPVRYDTFLGSVVGEAFPMHRGRRDMVVKPPQDVVERRPTALAYPLDTPLNATPFADGDEIQVGQP